MNFRCKLRHRRSIHRPWISVRVQNVGDLATISVDFCIFYAECSPYFYFRFVWPIDLESIPHASTPTSTITTKFEAHTPIRSWAMSDNVFRYFLLFYWKCVRCHCACIELRDQCVEGQKTTTYLESPTPICLFTIQLYLATTTIKGRLLSSVTIIRSWVTSYNGSRCLALKMGTRPLRMRRITWPVRRGSKNNHIFGIPDPDSPIHYTTFIGLRRRLRVVSSRAL